jgi:hypothetical protein
MVTTAKFEIIQPSGKMALALCNDCSQCYSRPKPEVVTETIEPPDKKQRPDFDADTQTGLQ